VRRANFDGARVRGIGESEIKDGVQESGAFGDGVVVGGVGGSALEKVVGAGDGVFEESVFPDEGDLAKGGLFEAGNVFDGQGVFAVGVKGFEGEGFQSGEKGGDGEPELDCEVLRGGSVGA